MSFQSYLEATQSIATIEKNILDELSVKTILSPIELRAAKSSMQVLIENAIGKAKRILKYYNSPMVPKTGRDAVLFLFETGCIDEQTYRELNSAIGFRNTMIHDYMEFDENVLMNIVKNKKYETIYRFLMWDVMLNTTQKRRIETYEL